jgi:hypothetical protein
MSIDYFSEDRAMIMSCDKCGDESTFYGAFKPCIEEAKEEGWLITREPDTDCWMHVCLSCKNPTAVEDFK